MSTSDKSTKGRILVADDDPAILRLVSTILEKEGYEVVPRAMGAKPTRHLQADADFTAAVFDVVMPHITGPELVRYMRTEKRFMNDPGNDDDGRAGSETFPDSFSAGAVVFLPKPFTTAQLQTMLRMLVSKAGK